MAFSCIRSIPFAIMVGSSGLASISVHKPQMCHGWRVSHISAFLCNRNPLWWFTLLCFGLRAWWKVRHHGYIVRDILRNVVWTPNVAGRSPIRWVLLILCRVLPCIYIRCTFRRLSPNAWLVCVRPFWYKARRDTECVYLYSSGYLLTEPNLSLRTEWCLLRTSRPVHSFELYVYTRILPCTIRSHAWLRLISHLAIRTSIHCVSECVDHVPASHAWHLWGEQRRSEFDILHLMWVLFERPIDNL